MRLLILAPEICNETSLMHHFFVVHKQLCFVFIKLNPQHTYLNTGCLYVLNCLESLKRNVTGVFIIYLVHIDVIFFMKNIGLPYKHWKL